ncbi:MAG: FadR/GntR family transcriptional regulator [Treponemataceae bacterium]
MAKNNGSEGNGREDLLSTPIKRVRVYEDIVRRILYMIQEGDLKIGDRLPAERDLSNSLGVSRSSVREALRALELLGHIETRVGIDGGSFVREVGFEKAQSILKSMFNLSQDSVTDLIEVRMIVETRSASLAAERRRDEDIVVLDEAISLMEDEIKGGDVGIKGDHTFHAAVAKASRNNVLFLLSEMLEEMIEDTRLQSLSLPGVPELALLEHKNIVKAIKAGNGKTAERHMHTHLNRAYEISKGN